MDKEKHQITILLDDFLKSFLPKVDQLPSRKEKVVCARLLKAAIENYIEKNDK